MCLTNLFQINPLPKCTVCFAHLLPERCNPLPPAEQFRQRIGHFVQIGQLHRILLLQKFARFLLQFAAKLCKIFLPGKRASDGRFPLPRYHFWNAIAHQLAILSAHALFPPPNKTGPIGSPPTGPQIRRDANQ